VSSSVYSVPACRLTTTASTPACRAAFARETRSSASMRSTVHGASAGIGMPLVPYVAARCATVIIRPSRRIR
jgi:hypothetical protein